MLNDDFIVVTISRMNYFFTFACPFQDIRSNFWVPTFHLMICCFSDIMQQTTTARELRIESHHFRDHPGQKRYLHTM